MVDAPDSTIGLARSALVDSSLATLKDIFRNVPDLSNADSIVTLRRGEIISGSARFNISRDGATGYWEFLCLRPGYYMVITNTVYKDDIDLSIPGEGLLEFHFKLSGQLMIVRDDETLAEVIGPKILIWKQNENVDLSERIFGGQRETSITIYCDEEFIDDLFGPIADVISDDAKHLLFNNSEPVLSRILDMPPSMAVRADGFFNSVSNSPLRLLQAEAAGIELMCAALNELTPLDAGNASLKGIKKLDAIKLHEAHDVLNKEFPTPPTIPALARRIGLNETKLKTGFKALFSCTIAEFVRKRRMERACQLMRQSSMPISHVADAVGYEHQNSFTVAFKAHFGVLPKDFRKGPTQDLRSD